MKLYPPTTVRHRRRAAAVTLIENVLAIALVAIMGTALMTAFGSGFITLRLTRENQRATQIILEKMETLRLYSWDQINQANFIPTNFTDVYDPQAPTNHQGTIYTGTLNISAVPFNANYADSMRMITVTLDWTTGDVDRQRTMYTFVSQDGLQNYVY